MFTGYITRLADNYPAPALVAWELAPRHYLDKKTRWLPSHPQLEEVLARRHILTSLPRLLMGHSTKALFLSSAAFSYRDPGVRTSTLCAFDRVTEVLWEYTSCDHTHFTVNSTIL